MRIIHLMGIALTGTVMLACASGPIDIPEDLDPEELIQRGQEASDRGRYKQALQYYEAVIDRFPSYIDLICAAEYEIAFIHYKRKLYPLARDELNALLGRYDTPDGELLPPQFRILSEIVLERITEKENAVIFPFLKKKR